MGRFYSFFFLFLLFDIIEPLERTVGVSCLVGALRWAGTEA